METNEETKGPKIFFNGESIGSYEEFKSKLAEGLLGMLKGFSDENDKEFDDKLKEPEYTLDVDDIAYAAVGIKKSNGKNLIIKSKILGVEFCDRKIVGYIIMLNDGKIHSCKRLGIFRSLEEAENFPEFK